MLGLIKLIRHIKIIRFLLNSTLYDFKKLNDIIVVNKHVNKRKLHNQELHYNQLYWEKFFLYQPKTNYILEECRLQGVRKLAVNANVSG